MTINALPTRTSTNPECLTCHEDIDGQTRHLVNLHKTHSKETPFHTACHVCVSAWLATTKASNQSMTCLSCGITLEQTEALERTLNKILKKISPPKPFSQRLGQSLERKLGRLLNRLHLRRNQPDGAQAATNHITRTTAATPRTNTELSVQGRGNLEATRNLYLQRIHSINQELIELANQDFADNSPEMNSVIALTQELDECSQQLDSLFQRLGTPTNSSPPRATQTPRHTAAAAPTQAATTPRNRIVLM